ncbi:MAG: hypothetical protein L6455_08230 [Kiritimatiellae bacterium]|nr:hypothetical protein [Kiritimatiellia bacterium]
MRIGLNLLYLLPGIVGGTKTYAAGLWSLYQALANGRDGTAVTPIAHLPLAIPYFVGRLWRGVGNRGDVKCSSGRLFAEGFRFPLGVTEAVRKIIQDRREAQ